MDNNWDNPGNWTDGVPGIETTAVFNSGGEITLPDSTPLSIGGIRFASSATESVIISRALGEDFSFTPGDAIVVEAGSGSHTINNSTNSSAFFSFVPGQKSYIRNYSTGSTLTLIGRHNRTEAGTPELAFDGSGDILITGAGSTLAPALGIVSTEATMTGKLIIDASATIAVQNSITLNGGILVLDGAVVNRGGSFIVNAGATVTGRGIIGRSDRGPRNIQIEGGGRVNAGRIGETGKLEFHNNPVYFNEGSIMTFDLISYEDHDQFEFKRLGDVDTNIIPILYLDEVILELNLLSGFSANIGDVFTILTGYDSLEGQFAGLDDGDILMVGGHEFQIQYGANSTSLQVTAIPEVEAASLLLSLLAFLGYRIVRHSKKNKS